MHGGSILCVSTVQPLEWHLKVSLTKDIQVVKMTGQEKAQTIAGDHPARLGAADQPEAMAAATKVEMY